VVVLRGLTAGQAGEVLQRTQEELLVAGAKGDIPAFTVSYGVTDSYQAGTLEELLRIADLQLFRAKREGRNRIALDTAEQPEPTPASPVTNAGGAPASG
jgi:PleD family two-component response regulator